MTFHSLCIGARSTHGGDSVTGWVGGSAGNEVASSLVRRGRKAGARTVGNKRFSTLAHVRMTGEF